MSHNNKNNNSVVNTPEVVEEIEVVVDTEKSEEPIVKEEENKDNTPINKVVDTSSKKEEVSSSKKDSVANNARINELEKKIAEIESKISLSRDATERATYYDEIKKCNLEINSIKFPSQDQKAVSTDGPKISAVDNNRQRRIVSSSAIYGANSTPAVHVAKRGTVLKI